MTAEESFFESVSSDCFIGQVVAACFTITEYNLQKLLVRLVKESGTISPIQKAAIAFNKEKAKASRTSNNAALHAEAQLEFLPKH